jgi:hypothetical protein
VNVLSVIVRIGWILALAIVKVIRILVVKETPKERIKMTTPKKEIKGYQIQSQATKQWLIKRTAHAYESWAHYPDNASIFRDRDDLLRRTGIVTSTGAFKKDFPKHWTIIPIYAEQGGAND